eukprot:CAMPEP_0172521432 /NCGR_PEP_ID=MMETSP1066-20121228/292576_1 /TAXON_ID=671091 /ORGANISM="Coscinodiscus wailesii, Strain CCMP2513" /LENGTH=488 /DNA_ID=CAMNT_0013304345 /DNA_START=218 /DNA_END=1681 /DNA_ORIENTATION=+
MSSGTLPLSKYHRAQSLGAGSFGSVMIVYNDDGDEYAYKLFTDDDDDDDDCDLLNVGVLREISVLRLLRSSHSHKNIISIHDVVTPDGDEESGGAGTEGYMGLVMPVFHDGTLAAAIASQSFKKDRPGKVAIAHGLLSAVAYLHDNAIMHRDIKCDNVLLKRDDSGGVTPVLIDFSLAKVIPGLPGLYPHIPANATDTPASKKKSPPSSSSSSAAVVDAARETTHTPFCGTPTYRAPEVTCRKPYGLPSDMWSVGVVLLELLQNKILPAETDRTASHLIDVGKGALPRELLQNKILPAETDRTASHLIDVGKGALPRDKPLPDLVRGLLDVEPSTRLTAREALSSDVFRSFGHDAPPVCVVDVATAVPLETVEDDNEEDNENVFKGANLSKRQSRTPSKKKGIDAKASRRFRRILKICRELLYENPLTPHAAYSYSLGMDQMDDTIDDEDSAEQTLLDCVVLAQRFYEVEGYDLEELDNEDEGMFADW